MSALVENGIYQVEDEGILLMPEKKPEDPMAALTKVRRISPGAVFKVKWVEPFDPPGDLTLWYRVMFPGSPIAGWINSQILVGKKITEIGESRGEADE